MFRSNFLVLAAISLVSGLVFPPSAPYVAVYATIMATLIGGMMALRLHADALTIMPFRLLALGNFLFVATLPFVLQNEGDLFVFALLAPVLLAPALAMLLEETPEFVTPMAIALLCCAGAAAALIIASHEVFVIGRKRVELVNNPIHFGGLALMPGFLSLIGLFASRSQWRFLFLFGPLFSAGAVILAGTSGPILSLVILSLVIAPLLAIWFWRENGFRIAAVITMFGLAGGLMTVTPQLLNKGVDGIVDVVELLVDRPHSIAEAQVSTSTKERLQFYQASYQAFSDAPIFGHGSGHLGDAVDKYIPEDYEKLRNPQHMHSDIADFAVIGGLFGLMAYVSFLAAPLLTPFMTTDTQTRRMLWVGALVLSGGYFCLGLTNAVFGMLPQTALYGVCLGCLVALARTTNDDSGVTHT